MGSYIFKCDYVVQDIFSLQGFLGFKLFDWLSQLFREALECCPNYRYAGCLCDGNYYLLLYNLPYLSMYIYFNFMGKNHKSTRYKLWKNL